MEDVLDYVAHLEQLIVDLNKALKPALNVVDATEFIVTNGPFGPGELLKPRKVVAGTDPVAVDAYCASLWACGPRTSSRSAGLGAGSEDARTRPRSPSRNSWTR